MNREVTVNRLAMIAQWHNDINSIYAKAYWVIDIGNINTDEKKKATSNLLWVLFALSNT